MNDNPQGKLDGVTKQRVYDQGLRLRSCLQAITLQS